jgi:hypothetical protein
MLATWTGYPPQVTIYPHHVIYLLTEPRKRVLGGVCVRFAAKSDAGILLPFGMANRYLWDGSPELVVVFGWLLSGRW